VREPGNTPGLDTTLKPTSGDIHLTIVNGDNAGANYGTMDVSRLTDPNAPKTGTETTATATDPNAAAQALPLSAIPGQSGNVTVVNANASSAPVVVSQTTKQTSVASSEKSTAKPAATTAKAAPAKEVTAKTVIVTEYWIQTGSFSSKLNAEKARETLTARYLKAEIFTKDSATSTNYRVRVGPYKSKSEADYWLGTVKEIPDFKGSYVSEVKTKK
jgi:cell division protein FtsN